MLKFLCRAIGLVLLAAGFVGCVVDGTRSIANGVVSLKPLGEVAAAIFKERFLLLQPAVERGPLPFLWDPVLRDVFLVPASLLGIVLGAILLWLGQRRRARIGFETRR